MIGMTESLYAQGDLTAKARIRDATMALIAEQGLANVSVRGIAARSSVSPALVLHHFGSKRGVFDEVSRWVSDVMHQATSDAAAGATPAEAHRRRIAAMDRLMWQVPYLGGYLRQLLLDPSPDGIAWFQTAVSNTVEDLRDREKQGMARPSSDVQAEAAMLVILSMAPVYFRPFLEAALSVDFGEQKSLTRWRTAESELLTSALYPPSKPG
jgi:AcrR family transcriptional regulator